MNEFQVRDLIYINSDRWDDVGVIYRIESIDYVKDSFSFNALVTNTETGYQYTRRVPLVQAKKVAK